MAKVAMITVPIHGGIRPILVTAKELVKRGEEVLFYATEEYRTQIEATGAQFRAYRGKLNKVEVIDDDMVRFFESMIEMTLDKLDYNLEAIRGENPDYIVHDSMCICGKLIATLLAVPAVNLLHSFPMTQNSLPPLSLGLMRLGLQLAGLAIKRRFNTNSALSQIKQRHGIALDLRDMGINREPLNIIYTMPELEPKIAANESDYLFVGPSFFFKEESTDFPFQRLLGKRVVYISLGTVHNDKLWFYQLCSEALADAPFQVVLSTGPKVFPRELDPIPDNFIVRQWNPQQQLLAHTDLFVTHSGMNSVNEALFHGVPMLLLPHQPEQAAITRSVCKLGAGLHLEIKKLTVDSLRTTIERMLNERGLTKCAQALSRGFQTAEKESHMRAAEAILSYIGERSEAGEIESAPVSA